MVIFILTRNGVVLLRKFTVFVALLAVAALLPLQTDTAEAAQASDITKGCTIKPSLNVSSFRRAMDGNTRTVWRGAKGAGQTIDIRTGSEAGCVYIRWDAAPPAWTLYAVGSDGSQDAVASGGAGYLTDCAVIPEAQAQCGHFVLRSFGSEPFEIAELTVFKQGTMPEYVPRWSPFSGRTDIMLVAAHPDDDQLYLGAVTPTYAQHGKREVTVVMTYGNPERRFEALEGAWAAGSRICPVLGPFRDGGRTDYLEEAKKAWPEKEALGFIVEQIRKYKPAVIVTQDTKGEYGHGAHKLTSLLVQEAFKISGDAESYPDSAKKYGVWNPAELYIHLYKSNKITLDTRVPLPLFGGRTAYDMARAGYARHISQHQYTSFQVRETKYSIREFGLFDSRVGYDNQNNDMFTNVSFEKLMELNPAYLATLLPGPAKPPNIG